MAKRFWKPETDPIGQQITLTNIATGNPYLLKAPGSSDALKIVGIVGNVRNDGMRKDPASSVYVPMTLGLFPITRS